MGRKPGTTCTTCHEVGTRAEMKRDGGSGYCHKEPCGPEGDVAADDRKASADAAKPCPYHVDATLPCDVCAAADAAADAALGRVAKTTKPTATVITGARVVAGLPGGDRKRVNRRGKPTVASEAARTCRVRGCACTADHECDLGAGRTCSWTSAETPSEGDTCSLCASLIDAAGEVIGRHGGAVPAGLAEQLFEDCDAPALGETLESANARLGACIEIAAARAKPTKDRPRDTSKKRDTVAAPPAQAALPGSEVARTGTLPFPREPLAALPDERGACSKCGEALTRDNSSRLPGGAVAHIGCPATPSAEGPIELSCPCAACDANRGEACAWATPEPASYVHPCRVRLHAAEQQREIARRAVADCIRVLCDHFAGLPSVHPMPTEATIVRAIASDGTPADLAAEVFAAMRERGELVAHGEGSDAYYRAAGSAPVVMGRVGVKAAPVHERDESELEGREDGGTGKDPEHVDEGYDAEAREAGDSGGAFALVPLAPEGGAHLGHCSWDEPCGNCAALDEGPTRDAAVARLGAAGMADTARAAAAEAERAPCDLCGGKPSEAACSRCGREGTLPLFDGPPRMLHQPNGPDGSPEDCDPAPLDNSDPALSPAERVSVELQEAMQALVRLRGHLGTLLGAEVRERAAVAQLDAVQRERDEERAHSAQLLQEVERQRLRVEMSDAAERAARAEIAQGPIDLAHWMRREAAAIRERDQARAELEAARADAAKGIEAVARSGSKAALGLAGAERERDAAETAIRELAEAVGVDLGASPAETCAEIGKLSAQHAKEAAYWVKEASTARIGEKGLRAERDEARASLALANPADAEERIRVSTIERDSFAARVLALRAGIVSTLREPPADPASLTDADLVSALRSDRAPELDGVVAAAVYQLTGEAPPMGAGVAPLAAALGEAVRAVLARLEATNDALANRLGSPAASTPALATATDPPAPARRRPVDFT